MSYIEIFWKDKSVSPICCDQPRIVIDNIAGRLEMYNEQYGTLEYCYFEDISRIKVHDA